MAENRIPLSFSIPHNLNEYLEHEAITCNTKKSSIIQEELYNRMKRKKNEGKDKMAFSLLLVVIGITLLGFSIFLMPVIFIMFIALGFIGMIALLTGYLGVYVVFKEKRLVKG